MSHTHIAIICATFYHDLSQELLDAAKAVLNQQNVHYTIIDVPGCFEIPSAVNLVIKSKKFDGAIALGAVIRGETSHYDYVCGESARGINQLAMEHDFPIGYGIITAENQSQARVRADAKQKNVGGRAAQACIDILTIKENLLI